MRKILQLTLAASAIAAAASVAIAAEAKPYSVCQVVDQAGTLAGKTITVRGLFGGTTFHGHFVAQGSGDDPCPGWRARFLTSPSVILLGAGPTAADRADVIEKLTPCLDAYREARFTRYRVEIVGVLRRKSRFPLIFRRPDGSYISWYSTGFGEGSGFPLMLEVKGAKCPN